jgi:hypothetical protein
LERPRSARDNGKVLSVLRTSRAMVDVRARNVRIVRNMLEVTIGGPGKFLFLLPHSKIVEPY